MSNKNEITIVIPDGTATMETREQKVIELFITDLLSALTGKKYLKISYEKRHNIFSCNDRDVKELLRMIVQLKMLNDFYTQFKNMLFNNKTLKLVKQNQIYEIDIQESGNYPDFTWIITKPI